MCNVLLYSKVISQLCHLHWLLVLAVTVMCPCSTRKPIACSKDEFYIYTQGLPWESSCSFSFMCVAGDAFPHQSIHSCLVLAPLNDLQVDALLHHLPQGAHLSQLDHMGHCLGNCACLIPMREPTRRGPSSVVGLPSHSLIPKYLTEASPPCEQSIERRSQK